MGDGSNVQQQNCDVLEVNPMMIRCERFWVYDVDEMAVEASNDGPHSIVATLISMYVTHEMCVHR